MDDQTKRLRGGAVEVCHECDIAGCRHIRARAALAAQPAASAEPEQYKTDDELGGVLAAIRHYGGQKWMEGRGVADDDLKNVREAWDAVYERVQALARYGKAVDAFWSRNGLRATLAPQPAASADLSDAEVEQAIYEVAGVFVKKPGEPAEFHCRRDELPRIARALLSRYGRPAGDAQLAAEVFTMETFEPHRTTHHVSLLKPLPAGTKLYTEPVAAQKADDGPTCPICGCPGGRHSGGSTCTSAAIAQQRKEGQP